MPDSYYAAACQTDFPCPATRSEIAERTSRMCSLAEQTIVGYEPFNDVRLLAFPEFAHAAPIYDSVAKLRDRLAVPLPMAMASIRYWATAAVMRRAASWRLFSDPTM